MRILITWGDNRYESGGSGNHFKLQIYFQEAKSFFLKAIRVVRVSSSDGEEIYIVLKKNSTPFSPPTHLLDLLVDHLGGHEPGGVAGGEEALGHQLREVAGGRSQVLARRYMVVGHQGYKVASGYSRKYI